MVSVFIYQLLFDGLFLSIDFDINTTPKKERKSFKKGASQYAMCINVDVWFSLSYFLFWLYPSSLHFPPYPTHTHLFILKLGPLGQYNKYLCSEKINLVTLMFKGLWNSAAG